ncbi:hypothetical protein ACH5RR_008392 [Cinchona calisaya]|uniref:Uncharacterized protein n=1 Tax=Cinchona calisaya TaxID=153742 RepID=A0ABD3AB89_9GENT
MPKTSGKHENLETLHSPRKDEVIYKQYNRPIQLLMPRVQTSNLPILRDGRALLGPKANFYPRNVVNMIMVEVKPIEPLESRNQDRIKEIGEIRSIKTLGTNKTCTNANKKKKKGQKKNKEGQETSTGSSIGPVERDHAKEKAVMTCWDEQRRITHSMSKEVTIGENVKISIKGSSSEKT